MRFLTSFLVTTLLSFSAFAGFQGFGGTTDLKTFNKIWCSTGLTCTKVGDKFKMVSSPSLTGPLTLESAEVITNATDDTVSIQSNDEVMTLQVLGFEAKSAILELWADQGDDATDKFSFTADTSNNLTLKNNTTALLTFSSAGAMTAVGSLTGDGGDALSGFLQAQVASTTAAITAAQCGSTFVSNSADVMTLPEASTVLGCRLTFICGTADDFDINPDDADVIGPINSVAGGTGAAIAPSAGDAIRCTDIGSSITIEAIGAALWVPVGVGNGAWTDVN